MRCLGFWIYLFGGASGNSFVLLIILHVIPNFYKACFYKIKYNRFNIYIKYSCL